MIGGKAVPVPMEITHHPPFKSRRRRRGTLVNAAVIHQSVTSSVESTERVLRKKGLGVHFMIDGDGSIHQYNDLSDKLAHGNELNNRSCGVEIINPYTRTKGYWQKMIDPSPTAWRKKEAADTDEQIASLEALMAIICTHKFDMEDCKLEIPLDFPTQSEKGPNRGSPFWFDSSVGGIIAHGHRPARYPDFHEKAGQRVKGGHADGRMTVWRLSRLQRAEEV